MATKIGQAEGLEFWEFEGDVYRVRLPYGLDAYGLPMGRRWECSVAHFDRYRTTVFGWVESCGEVD